MFCLISIHGRDERCPLDLSVVIPCLNEAAHLPLLLADLQRWPTSLDITVVDGGSSDQSQLITALAGARLIIEDSPGRGRQLATGARQATGDWLLFLHADSRLAIQWGNRVLSRITSPDAKRFAWFFDLRIAPSTPARSLLQRGIALRSRWCQSPYGDQGLLLHRTLYERSGGYACLPLMEDLDLVQRIGQLTRLQPLELPLTTDGRRWDHKGVVRCSFENAKLRQRWRRGESPAQLAADYYQSHLESNQLEYQKPHRWPWGSKSQPSRS